MHANTRLKPAGQANKSSDLEIIYRPLSELKLDPTNPRLRSKKRKTDPANQRKRQVFGEIANEADGWTPLHDLQSPGPAAN